MAVTFDAPYLPLHIAREHIDAIEGLWLFRQGEAFATKTSHQLPETWTRRLEAHVRALSDDIEDAVREASLRLASVRRSAVFAGAYVLLRIAPERCFNDRGALALRSHHVPALAEALVRSSTKMRFDVADPVAMEAQSASADLPEGVLIAKFFHPNPRSGLLAAARADTVPAWARNRLIQLATARGESPRKRWRPLALYAWGVLAARAYGGADPAFASMVDGVVGDDLFSDTHATETWTGESASLIAMALVGHAATARRIERRISETGPSLELVYALGLLGVPRYSRALLSALGASDPSIRSEAVRSLYFLTGQMFERTEKAPMREDGTALEPDRPAADAYFRGWAARDSVERHHLGVPLRSPLEAAPPSFRFLRAVLIGGQRSLRAELLPSLFDGRPRTSPGPFTIAPGRHWAPAPPRPRADIIRSARRDATPDEA